MSDYSAPSVVIPFRPPPGLSLPAEGEENLSYPNLKPGMGCAPYPGLEQQNIPAGSAETDPMSEDKEVRKLEKKLRDICKLETRRDAGEKLDPLQVKKIEKKNEVEDEIKALKERLMKEIEEGQRQLEEQLAPPPGFEAGKLGFNSFDFGESLPDHEDDATTLPGSTASEQGGDSDSESQISELTSKQRLSANAPAFDPMANSFMMPPEAFAGDWAMQAMQAMLPHPSTTRTPLKKTNAMFTPTPLKKTDAMFTPKGGKLRQDAPVFVPGALSPMMDPLTVDSSPEADQQGTVTWRSTRRASEEKLRTKLTPGSAELFVPQFPDLKASMVMKTKDTKVKAKKATQA